MHCEFTGLAVDETEAAGDVTTLTEICLDPVVDDFVQSFEVALFNSDFLRVEHDVCPERCYVQLICIPVDEGVCDSRSRRYVVQHGIKCSGEVIWRHSTVSAGSALKEALRCRETSSVLFNTLLVPCPRNNFTNLLVFFAADRVAPPPVGPTTVRRRALPATKNPAQLHKVISGTGH